MAPLGRSFLFDRRAGGAHRLVDRFVGAGQRGGGLGARCLRRLMGRPRLAHRGLRGGQLPRPPFDLVTSLQRRVGPAHPDESLGRHDVPGDADRLPPVGEPGQQRQRRLQGRQPDDRPQELAGDAGRVAPDGLGEGPAAGLPRLLGRGRDPVRRAPRSPADGQVAPSFAQGDDVCLVDDVRLDRRAQRGLHRGTQLRRDLESGGQGAAAAARGRLDPPGRRRVRWGGERVQLGLEGGVPCVRCRAGRSRLRDLLRGCPERRVRRRLGSAAWASASAVARTAVARSARACA